MKKNHFFKFSLLGFIQLIISIIISGTTNLQAQLNGTFIDPYNSNLSKVTDLLKEQYGLGMRTIVIQKVGIFNKDGSKTYTGDDAVANILKAADKYKNMKVYIGLYMNQDEFWKDPLKTQLRDASSELADRIKSTFDKYKSFAGYFISQEIDLINHDPVEVNSYFAPLVSHIQKIDAKPVIISGFFKLLKSDKNTPAKTPEEIEETVKKFVSGNNTDIFLLQDGVGGFDNPIDQPIGNYKFKDYLSAVRSAIDQAGKDKKLWIEPEIFQYKFTNSNNNYVPSIITQVVKQINLEKQFADKGGLISYIAEHQMTENSYWSKDPVFKYGARHLKRGYEAYFNKKGKVYSNFKYEYLTGDNNLLPESDYPDTGTKLDDDVIGQGFWFKNYLQKNSSDWVGFHNSSSSVKHVVIIADLGKSNSTVSDVSTVVMSRPSQRILYPENITVAVSKDKSSWSEFDTKNGWTRAQDPDTKAQSADTSLRQILFVSSPDSKTGRYVKIDFEVRPKANLFLSEIEIYGIKVSSKKSSKSK